MGEPDHPGLMDFLHALVGASSKFSPETTDDGFHTEMASGNSFACPGSKRICSLIESWNFGDLERQQAEASDAKRKEKEARKAANAEKKSLAREQAARKAVPTAL